MNAECTDRERILREAQPEELAALTRHAETCAECARELRIWNEISLAARTLQKSWESPALWPRVREALILEAQSDAARRVRGVFASLWPGLALRWQPVAAALALVIVTAAGTWMFLRPSGPASGGNGQPVTVAPDANRRLLTDQTLREVQDAEQAYVKSIAKLSALAEPKLEHASSPLLASYREKLLVLDSAIAECKAGQEKNPLNAHLRHELLSIYQEKQRTLEAVLRED
jgi:hypothetical protein